MNKTSNLWSPLSERNSLKICFPLKLPFFLSPSLHSHISISPPTYSPASYNLAASIIYRNWFLKSDWTISKYQLLLTLYESSMEMTTLPVLQPPPYFLSHGSAHYYVPCHLFGLFYSDVSLLNLKKKKKVFVKGFTLIFPSNVLISYSFGPFIYLIVFIQCPVMSRMLRTIWQSETENSPLKSP